LVLLAFLITLLFAGFLGASRSEVSRTWLFLLPFPVLYLAQSLSEFLDQHGTKSIVYLFAIQYALVIVYKVRLTMIVVPELFR
jgi:hypothetical protein